MSEAVRGQWRAEHVVHKRGRAEAGPRQGVEEDRRKRGPLVNTVYPGPGDLWEGEGQRVTPR